MPVRLGYRERKPRSVELVREPCTGDDCRADGVKLAGCHQLRGGASQTRQ